MFPTCDRSRFELRKRKEFVGCSRWFERWMQLPQLTGEEEEKITRAMAQTVVVVVVVAACSLFFVVLCGQRWKVKVLGTSCGHGTRLFGWGRHDTSSVFFCCCCWVGLCAHRWRAELFFLYSLATKEVRTYTLITNGLRRLVLVITAIMWHGFSLLLLPVYAVGGASSQLRHDELNGVEIKGCRKLSFCALCCALRCTLCFYSSVWKGSRVEKYKQARPKS